MVDSRAPQAIRQTQENKALSNAEVKQLLRRHISQRVENPAGMSYLNVNEQGNVLRTQTLDYLDMFNDFEENTLIT